MRSYRTFPPVGPDGETTQPDTGIVGVAHQAPALAAAGLVEELKAEREDKREHELDKRLGVTKELKVSRLLLKIDGDGTVLACRLGCLSHLSPPVRWSLAPMRHYGGNVLKYQEYCEKRWILPLNPMESGDCYSRAENCPWHTTCSGRGNAVFLCPFCRV
jgi:hypothetical protein